MKDLIRKILKESEFDWVDELPTEDEVALDISNHTEITPNVFMDSHMIKVPFTHLQYSEPQWFPVIEFHNYVKNHYGVGDVFANNTWGKWKQEINSRLSEI